MKHASIFTRLAQRADPNIPILEAAMEEIARLEEKLETSGYSPFTEEVEDILRSKNQNLFNALMESKKRTGEQAAEITRLKGVIANASNRCIAQEERACRAEDALVDLVNQIRKTDPTDDHGHKTIMNMAYIKAVQLLDNEALAAIKEIES